MASLTQQSTRGGIQMIIGQVSKLLINFVSLMVLSRLLGAEEYGLLAMIVIILGIAEVFKDFGLTSAVIQAEEITPKEKTNLWWINVLIGFAIMAILCLLSPVIAWVYQEDRLVLITIVMSINFLLSSMSIQYSANLQREMRFGTITINGILANGAAVVVAIFMALAGWGVWALLAQYLAGSIFTLIIFILQTRWIPGWYDRKVSIRSYFNFGFPLMFSNLFMYLGGAVDVFVLGRLAGPETLGLLNRAGQVVRTPLNQLRTPLSTVAFSALSKRRSTGEELAKHAEQGQIILAYPLTLLAGGMAAASSFVITFVLGQGWESAIPFFFFLAIAGGLNNLAMTAGWLFMIKNKNRSLLRLTSFSVILRVISVLIGIFTLGPVGAAVGQVVAPLIQWPVSLIWAGKSTGIKTGGLMRNSYRIFFVSFFASGVTYFVAQHVELGLILNLLICIAVQVFAAVLLAVFPSVRRDYVFIAKTLKTVRR